MNIKAEKNFSLDHVKRLQSNIEVAKDRSFHHARQLPSNIEVEQMLLGAILVNMHLLDKVHHFLQIEHFFEPLHQKIYQAILKLNQKNITINVVTVKSMLCNDELFTSSKGEEYLLNLTNVAAIIVDIYNYGKIIHDLALKRQLIQLGEKMVNDSYNNSIDIEAFEQIEEAEAELFNLTSSGASYRQFASIGSALQTSMSVIDRAIKSKSKITGIRTGLVDLDKKLFGFQNSDLIILAGRPSMGKTALAVNLAFNCSKFLIDSAEDKFSVPCVGFFSLEMSSQQLATRILSMQTKINSDDLRSGNINEEYYNTLKKSSISISEMPIFIDDTPAITISNIVARARRLKRKNNLAILFIDYLQLIRTNRVYTDSSSRVLQISEITQTLKALAKELDIPIIALSQLSRAVEKRDNKKPMLSDLRESGSIEQDADIVMFIHRDEYYLLREEPNGKNAEEYAQWYQKITESNNVADLFFAKYRNGSVGNVRLYYDIMHSCFGDFDKKNNPVA